MAKTKKNKMEIVIEYDTRPEDFADMVTELLDALNIKYELGGEDGITITYYI